MKKGISFLLISGLALGLAYASSNSAPTAPAAAAAPAAAPTAPSDAVAATTAGSQPAAAPAITSFDQAQITDIQTIIKSYLVSNPEVLVAASQALQQKEAEQAQKTANSAIDKNLASLIQDTKTPQVGSDHATVAIVEFYDERCHHCQDMVGTFDNVLKKFPNAKMLFKNLPIFGGDSLTAAQAELAAYQQDPKKFGAFHNALMKVEGLNKEKIDSIAKTAGYDVVSLNKEMSSDAIKKELDGNFQLASAMGIMGTPAIVVISLVNPSNHQFIPGATSEQNLEQMLTKMSANK